MPILNVVSSSILPCGNVVIMSEAIRIREKHTGKPLNYQIVEQNRKVDHIWWVSDVSIFQTHFPNWKYLYNLNMNINDIFQEWENLTEKFQQE